MSNYTGQEHLQCAHAPVQRQSQVVLHTPTSKCPSQHVFKRHSAKAYNLQKIQCSRVTTQCQHRHLWPHNQPHACHVGWGTHTYCQAASGLCAIKPARTAKDMEQQLGLINSRPVARHKHWLQSQCTTASTRTVNCRRQAHNRKILMQPFHVQVWACVDVHTSSASSLLRILQDRPHSNRTALLPKRCMHQPGRHHVPCIFASHCVTWRRCRAAQWDEN